jgi:hypothetical protein
MSSSIFSARGRLGIFFQNVLGGLENLIQIKTIGIIAVATAKPKRTDIPELYRLIRSLGKILQGFV